MNKLQRITDSIATLDAQLSAVYKAMSLAEEQEEIDALDKLSLELLGKISKLEVSRHEARMMQHQNGGRYDNENADFIS